MNEKSAIKNPLKQGNYHFKRGEFKAALSCYLMAAERMPELKEIIEKNIFITKEAESLEKQSRKFAIVVHCFYLDIWTEIRELLLKTRINFDLFITTPSDSNFPNEA
ncbi:MAG: rhamnan synthesis F family protein, partial [Pseudomonas sp.]